ncbi:helix-turn-helix family protein [[Clostridium] sordellii ATCC 9714]|uniref:Helix-turn-helix family protein n=1 Tax=Paraclostridium sordellii TaxID=1505 RepID=A0ABP1XW18_PARSO|nr:XRE family transcriptional regulator [Paeniclostridium sordellii]EPZ61166.1 helix-turn-helix family protein [[Clostridium] sordellii ATCC 9714] [Paeniclostridium sordellii ATCC 9714]TAN66899.1 XRE family transcriptional regulator [Paeniclostridium sordellii 8483]CEJ75475.1 helix-turn-helix family protein (plasmid) [[Clostridium] sordellii] [Paeniclostridium sordellii]CEN22433.1 transcription regulator phage-related [[Clostridium] sordellii] [Paeniclostridium sordellii]CEN29762.1 transcripti
MLYNFNSNLKNLRTSKKLTQNDLAKALKVSRQTISNYENGSNDPDFYMIASIAKFFNCSIDSLVFDGCNLDLKNINDLINLNIDDIDINNIIDLLESKKHSLSKNIKKVDNIICTLETINQKNNFTSPSNFDIIKDDINNTNNEDFKTEIAEEISPVISIDKYKSSKNSIDVDFYNENNVFIVDASPFSSDETEKVYSYGNVSAGIPTFGEDSIEDEFNIFKYDLKYDSDHYFVLKVKGESMNRLYKNGDYLLVEKSCNYNLNKPVIVFLENEATVKFVEIDDFHITIIPYSTDPKFEPIHYPLKNYNYYIAGNVVGVINIIKDN